MGPYGRYGSKLVAACARAGVHYCDLTGESPWVKDMIDMHHAEAKRTGAKIVSACGFDSIPAVRGLLRWSYVATGIHHVVFLNAIRSVIILVTAFLFLLIVFWLSLLLPL